MDFAQQQRNPAKHLVGITFVILFHLLLVYALVTGLAQRVVEKVKKPVEVKIVEEVKPPPPPEKLLPPPPKLAAPPPPFIPPPEIPISAPPPPVTVTQVAPPPAAFTQQTAPPAAAPAPAGPPPAKNARVLCPNLISVQQSTEYPIRAARAGVNEGEATVHFVLKANGDVTDVQVTATPRVFAETATAMVQKLKCTATGQDTPLVWPIGFKNE
jgi:protein TonB